MKIDSTTLKAPPLRPISTPQKPAENLARATGSNTVANTAGLAAQSVEAPPVNAARIQEIKDAIAQGRFTINPEAIADGLIQTARDLVNSQRQA